MDLIYEQSSEKSGSQETLTKETSNLNPKTEESFHRIEDEISKTYNIVEAKAGLWGSSIGNFLNKNLKIDQYIDETKKSFESLNLDSKLNDAKLKLEDNFKGKIDTKSLINNISEKTNTYLDELDKELEQVENITGGYFNKFTQIFTNNIDDGDKDTDVDFIDENEGNLLFNVKGNNKNNNGNINITSNRTEAQLIALNSLRDLYLKNDSTSSNFQNFKSSKFNIESKTDEISQNLQNNQLSKLFNELVPEKISYEEFWAIYYYNVELIKIQELQRKKLLNKEIINTEQDDNLTWDDDEEEDDDKVKSDGTYELNSVNSSTVEVNKSPKKVETKAEDEEKDEEEEDDDDDWE
ncbi:hypothetical protein WICMUC_005959 [Wickerhamomyces mucosus]|uniref:BSD domain-containing protein n=1 Tax=Wickerhamomyces mucosus TaxID=1378264 RepID=A0A9P8P0R3_9ASCO|nr:hypothetical protein WICMUC_005959 [Wickerhamomyces mucosus]